MKTNFQKLLSSLGACEEAYKWAGEKTFDEVWATCQRGDWMLWLAKNVGVDLRPITLTKGHCAELVLHLMTDGRSRNAVAVAIRYGEGNATDEELSYAAASAAAASAAASAAAYYAASAAYYAAASAAAASAAASAFYASEKRDEVLLQCADICRIDIPAELIKAIHPEI